MKKIEINGSTGKSTVYVGESLKNLNNYIEDFERTIIITDENVNELYGDKFPEKCTKRIVIGTGESIKTLQTVEMIYKKLIEFEADRSFFIIGIGGGIVCDITGFAASTYMRGLKFGFVSTTLLSQVDASVGGKNGVNLLSFKNMVGVFNHPKFVICDIDMLNTLKNNDYICGIAEIVKHGMIISKDHFEYVEKHSEELLSKSEREVLEKIIYDSVSIKADVVRKDERESGERKKLNFGHTFGHAVEKLEKVPHGEAVSIGIIIASKISLKKGYISVSEYERIENLLRNLKLPLVSSCDKKEMMDVVLKDKKRAGSNIDIVLLKSIGEAVVEKVSYSEIDKLIQDLY
jgi:3-dehydroquinate synthase